MRFRATSILKIIIITFIAGSILFVSSEYGLKTTISVVNNVVLDNKLNFKSVEGNLFDKITLIDVNYNKEFVSSKLDFKLDLFNLIIGAISVKEINAQNFTCDYQDNFIYFDNINNARFNYHLFTRQLSGISIRKLSGRVKSNLLKGTPIAYFKIDSLNWNELIPVFNLDLRHNENKVFVESNSLNGGTVKAKVTLRDINKYTNDMDVDISVNLSIQDVNHDPKINFLKLYLTKINQIFDVKFPDTLIEAKGSIKEHNIEIFSGNSGKYFYDKFMGKYDIAQKLWTISSDKLSFLNSYIPDVANLTGSVQTKIQFFDNKPPKMQAELNNIGLTIPSTGLEITNCKILASSNENIFSLSVHGSAAVSDGINIMKDIEFKGKLNDKPNEIVSVNIFTNENGVPLIHTPAYQLYGKPTLNVIHYTDNKTLISGTFFIDRGIINIFDQDEESNVFSDDVVIITKNVKKSLQKNAYHKLLLSIFVDTNNPIKLKANSFEGTASAKIDIGTRKDGFYTASGRISIKEGVFDIGTKKLTINRGRILYPKGSLLNNPNLDIRLKVPNQNLNDEAGVYISGTLKNIDLGFYSTANQSDDDILKNMGISGLQNTSILANVYLVLSGFGGKSTGSKFLDFRSILANNDISIDTQQSSRTVLGSDTPQTYYVITKKISPKLRLKYLQDASFNGVGTFRGEYLLQDNLSLGAQINPDSQSADIQYSKEF